MRKFVMLALGMLFMSMHVLAQRTVTGTVTDSTGLGLPGVSVRVQGTNEGTTTNSNGNFSFSVPSSANSLVISSIGFATQTVAIPASGAVNVTLRAAAGSLNEVVITGFSRQRRSEYSGAGTKVQAQQINTIPMGSIDQILQGRSPGLLVTAGSGQPGSSARVQIRGAGSITGGSTPLYVIDGVPVEAGVFQSINPNDIESIDVLRDASATALYGNRGSAGVIVVTTKRGRAGQTVFSYSGQAGITEPGEQRFNMMNSADLLQFQEMLGMQLNNNLPGWRFSPKNPANAGLTPAQQAQNAKSLDSLRGINTNWADVFQRQGQFQSHDLNFSGGAGRTRFFTSVGLYDEEGIGLRSDMNRLSFRSNIDHQTSRLTAGINAYAGLTRRNFIESENGIALANPFAAAYLALPYHQLFNPDGSVAVGPGKVGPNAYDRLFTTTNKNNQIKGNLALNANYLVTTHINIGGLVGLDFRETIGERQINPESFVARNSGFPIGPRAAGQPAGGSFGESRSTYFNYITRGNVGYKNSYGLHTMDVQGYVEYTRERDRTFSYTGYGINTALIGTPAGITPGNTTNQWIPAVGGGRTQSALFAAILTGKYTFNQKYVVNLSVRRDGSSQLPEENRWNTFWSAGATWNVLRENFATGWSKINDLRVRGSVGTSASTTNFPLGNFGYLTTFGPVNYVGAGSTPGTVPANAGNADANWEKVRTINFGIDWGAFSNRLTGSLDLYDKRTIDNLITQRLPLETGFRTLVRNTATIQNRGVELQLNGDVVRTRDFTWNIGGNLAYNKNEVVDLGQAREFEQGTELVKEGLPLGSHYIVKWAGVDAATGAPLYFTKDGKVTNVYSDDDRVAEFGTYNAPWIGGFNTGVKYRGFALDAFFTFQEGFSRFNNQDFFQLNHAFALQGFNLRREMLTMWEQPGDVTDIQSPLYQRQFVSKDIQDASYLRFRNVNLSYTFGNNVVNSLRILSGLKVFVQAQNLYTWTNWTGFDPEDNNNIAGYEYPSPRTITFGLNVNFK